MPFSVGDVDKHNKGLTAAQKKKWVSVANSSLNSCVADGGSDKTCAPSAIRIANSTIKEEFNLPDAAVEGLTEANLTGTLTVADPPTPSKGRPMLVENLANLVAAFRALSSARDSYAEDETAYEELGWLVRSLRRLVVDEAAFAVAMASGSTGESLDAILQEIGARLSDDTRNAVRLAIDTLKALQDDDDAEKPTEDQALEVRVAIEEAIEALASVQEAAHADDDEDEDKDEGKGKKKFTKNKKKTKPIREAVAAEFDLGPRESILFEHVTPIDLVESDAGRKGLAFNVRIIDEGMSLNRVLYDEHWLRLAVPLIESRPIYADHPNQKPDGSFMPRSLTTKAGWYENIQYVQNEFFENADGEQESFTGIKGEVHFLENSAVSWLPKMMAEAVERGHPELVGLSIFAAGIAKMERDDEGPFKHAIEPRIFGSVDAVAEPGAGGMPVSMLAASKGLDPDVDLLKDAKSIEAILRGNSKITLDEIKEARPDLFNEDGTPKWNLDEAEHDPEEDAAKKKAKKKKADAMKEDAPALPAGSVTAEQVNELTKQLAEQQSMFEKVQRDRLVHELLESSSLPDKMKAQIRVEAEALETATTETVQAIIDRYMEMHADIVNEMGDRMQPLGGTWIVPAGQTKESMSPLDQVSLALDDFFGAPIPEEKKGRYAKIRSFTEFFAGVTGDRTFDGFYDKKLSWIGEYLEQPWPDDFFVEHNLPTAANVVGGGTVTMAGLLGTSINRALFNFYKEQPKWWEPIVKKEELSNLKQQERIRLHNFGSLTERTTDGAEYTELTWGETAENYTPTEYGNTVPVGRRAIINDDIRGIQSIPRLMAQSARITINEYVSNLFTQNSGNGPVLADAVQVFNAGSHQGNRITDELSRANLLTLRTVVQKMDNDASKRIGLLPKHLIVPVDLEPLGWELLTTAKVPESANNAENILANGPRGFTNLVVPEQWTDVNNWYIMADPSEITGIEMGFLFGREDPESFVQDAPQTGMVFTHDVITYKIRHNYGGDWLDYRAAAAGIVA